VPIPQAWQNARIEQYKCTNQKSHTPEYMRKSPAEQMRGEPKN